MQMRPSQIPAMASLSRGSSTSASRADAPTVPARSTGNGRQDEATEATSEVPTGVQPPTAEPGSGGVAGGGAGSADGPTPPTPPPAPRAKPKKRRRWRRRAVMVAVAVPLVLLLVAVAVWAVDVNQHQDEALRGTVVAGQTVGGLTEDEVAGVVDDAAAGVEAAAVEIETPDGTVEATAEQLGVEVDRDATVDAVMDVGRNEGLVARADHWVRSWFSETDVPLEVSASVSATEAALTEIQGDQRVPPTEPSVAWDGQQFAVTAGEPGQGIDPQAVVDALPAAAADGGDTLRIEAERGEIPPRFSEDDAQAVADHAAEITQQPLELTLGGTPATVPVETLRPWLSAAATDDGLQLAVDGPKVQEDLNALLPDVGEPAVDASFAVVFGQVAIDPGRDGTGCCAEGSSAAILEALEDGTSVDLELAPVPPAFDEAAAEELGIVEEVGRPNEFGPTTNHACCESRVTNIHRMADLVRGYVIMPNGGEFDINDHVGERTTENGFVPAGAIENGEHVTHIGGGVSQFATTIFNAAFFAGLDIPNYQFHTEYLSRYPYGRESTVSYPAPDFTIVNNTPYGVLIWPTYTDTSITVHLYSTQYAVGEQTGQTTSQRGSCTDVVTTRTRTYPDGSTETDQFSGYYRNSGPTCG